MTVHDAPASHRAVSRYGYGSNIPTTARRRLKQSVALARKLLTSQKKCVQLEADLAAANQQAETLQEKLDNSADLLRKASQPYHYLVETVQQRDATIAELQVRLQVAAKEVRRPHRAPHAPVRDSPCPSDSPHPTGALVPRCDEQAEGLKEDKARLARVKNALTADLEQLLQDRQEVQQLHSAVRRLKMSPAKAAERDEPRVPPDPEGHAGRQADGTPGWFIQLQNNTGSKASEAGQAGGRGSA